MNDNRQNLYNTLKKEGYNPPAYEQFAKDMEDENNLRSVYSTLQKEGYTPPDFETFKKDMGFVSQPAQAHTPQAYNPATFAPMQRSWKESAMPKDVRQRFERQETASNYRQADTSKKQPTYKESPSGKSPSEDFRKSMDAVLGRTQQSMDNFGKNAEAVMENSKKAMFGGYGKEYNPTTGKFENVYYTLEGGKVGSMIEQADDNLRVTNPEKWQDKHTRMQVRGIINDADKQIEDKQKELFALKEEASRANQGDGSIEQKRENYKRLKEQIASKEEEINNLKLASKAAEEAREWIEASDMKREDKNALLTGLGNILSKRNTWTFGIDDYKDMLRFKKAAETYRNGEELTEEQQLLLQSQAVKDAVQGTYDVGRSYKIGTGVGESVPYIIEFLLNPATGLGSAASKAAAKSVAKKIIASEVKKGVKKGTVEMLHSALKKGGEKRLVYKLSKYGTRGLGDVAAAGAITSTSGQGRVLAGTMQRQLGNTLSDYDKNGNVVYAGQEWNDQNVANLYWKEFTSQMISNYSEMLGNYLSPALKELGFVLRGMGKGSGKVANGLQRVDAIIYKIGDNKIVKEITDFERKAQFHGALPETLEELADGSLNAAFVGDQTFDTNQETGIWNRENLIQTALVCGVMGTFFSGVKSVGYGKGKISTYRNLRKADNAASAVFGDQWDDIRENIKGAGKNIEQVLNSIADNPDYTPAQKIAAVKYAAAKIGADKVEEWDSKRERKDAHDLDIDAIGKTYESAYDDATSDELRLDANIKYADTREKVRQMVGDEILQRLDEDPFVVKAEIDNDATVSSNVRFSVAEYLASKAAVDGINDRINDDADMMAAEQREEAKVRTNKNDGAIHPATMKGEKMTKVDENGNEVEVPREVYVVDGDFHIDADGNISGDDMIIVYDPVEGRNRTISPAEIAELGEVTTAEQQEHNIEANKQAYIQQQKDKAEGKLMPDDEITYAEGQTVKVLEVGPEESSVLLPDGQVTTMPTETLQAAKDAKIKASYQERHPEEQKQPTATNETETKEETQSINEQPGADFVEVTEDTPKEKIYAPETILKATSKRDGSVHILGVVDGTRYHINQNTKKYEPSENGNFVKVVDSESGEERYLNTKGDYEYTVDAYLEPAAEVETPTEEQVEAPVAEQTEEQPTEPADEVEAPTEEVAEQPTVAPEVTIYNNVKGEYPEAYRDKVENTVKIKAKRKDDAKKALDKANADLTATEYGSKEESTAKAKRDKAQQAYDAAVADHEQWKAIKSLKDQEMLAEQEAKDAERKAKAEQRRAETEAARKREQEAYEAEVARRKAEKEKKIEASLNSMMQMREDSEPMEQMAKEWPIEDDAEAMEIMNDRSPRTLEEVAAWMLSDTKDTENKIDPELIREHTGYGTADFNKFPFIFKKGGMSPEAFGEKIEQTARENGVVFDENDTNIGFKALLNVLGEVGGLGDLKNYIKNNRIAEAEKLHNDRLREAVARKVEDDWIAQHGGMSREEYASYINWMEDAVEQRKTALTDEEYNQLFNTDYDTRTATTDEGSIERGAEKSVADEPEAGQTGVAADDTRGDGEEIEPAAEQPAGEVEEQLREAELASRMNVLEDEEYTTDSENGVVYHRPIVIDGKYRVEQVSEPNEKGDYTGSYYMYDGKRYGELQEVFNHIDGAAEPKQQKTGEGEPGKTTKRDKGKTWASVYGKKAPKGREADSQYEFNPYSPYQTYEESLAASKAAGYTKRQHDAMVERRRKNYAERGEKAKEFAEKLNLGDRVVILENADGLEDRFQDKKGWYDPRAGKITVVLDKHGSMDDILQTILHEGVGHHGLRQMFGKAFDNFLDNVYNAATPDVRHRINELTKKHGWDFRTGTEEYLAQMAETMDFEKPENQSWWMKIKQFFIDMLHKLGIKDAFKNLEVFSDNELRYILWRSYQNLVNPGRYRSFVDKANDVVMQDKLKVGNFAPKDANAERKEWQNIPMAAEPSTLGEFENKVKETSINEEYDRREEGESDTHYNRYWQTVHYLEDNNLSLDNAIEMHMQVMDEYNALVDNSSERAEELKAMMEALDPWIEAMEEWESYNGTAAEGDGIVFREGDDVPRAQARDAYERMMAQGANQFKEAVQDSMLSLKELYRAILGKDAKIEDVKGYENAYLAENRMHSASEAQTHAYQKDFIAPIVDAIYDLIGHGKFNKEKYDDLVDYMMAKHGLERNRVFAERDAQAAANNGADYDEELQKNQGRDYAGLTALTGESDVAVAEGVAQKMVDDYEANHDTAALWEKINRATKQSLYTLYSSGMMTKERYEQIRDMFDYYIPLQGFDSTVAEDVYAYLGSDGTLGYGTPIRTAKGRRSKADDPIATIAMNGEAAIRSANRNEMKKNFLNFVQNHPSDLVSVSEVWLKYNDVTGEWEQVTADLQDGDSPADVERKTKAFDEKMKKLSHDDPDHYKKASDMPNVPYRVVQSDNMKQHQVTVKRNGKDYVLTINGNPRAAQALNGLTNPDVFTEGVFGKAMNLGQWLNRQLSAFYTTRNPEFVLSNFLRDAIYSNMMVGTKEDGEYAKQFHKNFRKMNPVSMGKLFASWENGSLRDKVRNGTCTETERMFYDFMMNGGETGWTNMRDIEKHKKEIQSALKMEGSTNRKAWKALGSAFDLMNRSVENCARFAAFVTSRERGRSLERSIWDAKEISVNFNKKGAGDKFLTANNQTILGQIGAALGGLGRGLYVFWNASVQGLNNIASGAKRNPWKFAGRIVATNFLLGALMPIINEILTGGDDDDDKNSYYNLPEYIRRSNICFRFGKDMPWITIPLPIEFRAIYGLGELATGVLTGKERYTNEEFAKQFVSQLSQVLPLDFMEGGGGWHAFVPSQLKPFVEAQGNKSWTGLPIYKDTPFNQNDPEWTKAYKSANKQLVEATKWLNDLTNGSDYAADEKKGWIDINPAKLEYMLKGYFGGYSTMLDRFVKTAETVFGERDFEWRNIPMASRVLKEGDERTANRKLTNEYFDLIHEYDETKSIEKKKREKAESGDYIAKADYVAYTNFNENYKKAQVIDNFKPLLDALKDEKKNQSEYSLVEIEERENELRREMVDLIHSIQDAKKGQMPDIETPVDRMLDREFDRHGYTSNAAASRIASRMGGTDGYGSGNALETEYGKVYYNLRDHYDLRQDVAMQVAIKQAKDAGDDDRARDLDLARDSYNKNKKAFENGVKEAEQGLQWLRKDREQTLKDFGIPFDKRPEKDMLNR